ncbi:MAG: lysophospholipid acyltransferase family protein [Candidatus Omnitrophica bacterium]|nr:lysophospholipid acyltransferase family protein [Candidatus Omnitrophota bacterium]
MFHYFLYRIAYELVLRLPLRFSYWIADCVADLHLLFSFKSRRQVLQNLYWIYDGGKRPGFREARDVFHHFGRHLVDFLRLPKVDHEEFSRVVEIVGLEHIEKAFQKGKGVIGVTAHFGNWEWGGVGLAMLGYPVSAVVLHHESQWVNRFFMDQRRKKGLHVIPMDHSIWTLIQRLTRNEMVLLVGDRDFSKNGISLSFLGRRVSFPRGPAALSLRCGSPLIVGVVIRLPHGLYRLIFEAPIEPTRTDDFSSDLLSTTQQIASHLESYIRRYPTQWLIFQNPWEMAQDGS